MKKFYFFSWKEVGQVFIYTILQYHRIGLAFIILNGILFAWILASLFLSSFFLQFITGHKISIIDNLLIDFFSAGVVSNTKHFVVSILAIMIFIILLIIGWIHTRITEILIVKKHIYEEKIQWRSIYTQEAWKYFSLYIETVLRMMWYIFYPIIFISFIGFGASYRLGFPKNFSFWCDMIVVFLILLVVVYRGSKMLCAGILSIHQNKKPKEALQQSQAIVVGKFNDFFNVYCPLVILIKTAHFKILSWIRHNPYAKKNSPVHQIVQRNLFSKSLRKPIQKIALVFIFIIIIQGAINKIPSSELSFLLYFLCIVPIIRVFFCFFAFFLLKKQTTNDSIIPKRK